MNFIIVSKYLKAPKKLSLADRRVQIGVGSALAVIVGFGFLTGFLTRGSAQASEVAQLRSQLQAQQAELADAREGAQREVNALAARVGELQAQANRLNALGERLTRIGKLDDGEFEFSEPVDQGGPEPVKPIADTELMADLDALEAKFAQSDRQLDVLESLLFNRDLVQNQTPSRWPIRQGYISSGFGGRADPFSGGRAFHRGIDFDTGYGADVVAVAEGVVSFSGWRSGYGNLVEIDHGNGYKTLYGHNSRNLVKPGDLIRAGQQIAKVGSTGRSTGSHVHLEVHLNGRPVNPRQYLGSKAGRG